MDQTSFMPFELLQRSASLSLENITLFLGKNPIVLEDKFSMTEFNSYLLHRWTTLLHYLASQPGNEEKILKIIQVVRRIYADNLQKQMNILFLPDDKDNTLYRAICNTHQIANSIIQK